MTWIRDVGYLVWFSYGEATWCEVGDMVVDIPWALTLIARPAYTEVRIFKPKSCGCIHSFTLGSSYKLLRHDAYAFHGNRLTSSHGPTDSLLAFCHSTTRRTPVATQDVDPERPHPPPTRCLAWREGCVGDEFAGEREQRMEHFWTLAGRHYSRMVNMVVEESRNMLPCPLFGDGGMRDELLSILLVSVWTLVSGRVSSISSLLRSRYCHSARLKH